MLDAVTKHRGTAHRSGAGRRPAAQRPADRAAVRPTPGSWLLRLGLVIALTFAAYIPSLRNGFTNWDDNQYVTANPILAHPSVHAVLTTPLGGNYHPLTIWSLALNYRLSGLNPASYHWLNLLLHLANTALVFQFVRKLSGGRLWTSTVTSLFFGIHPMHVESVAWIAGRKDVLYALFYLIGLIAYLRFLERRRFVWLGAALLAYVLSAASKPAAVVFPLTLLAIDYFRRRALTPPVVLEKLPFFAISLIGGLLTLKGQHAANAIAEQWSLAQRILFASYGTLTYFVKLLVPVRLSALYPTPNDAAKALGGEYYAAFAVVAVLILAIVYFGRHNRVILFGLGFFFINIVLVLQFVSVGQAVMAERYTYLPYVGLLLALAWWLDQRPRAGPQGFPVQRAVAAGFLLLLPVSLYQTWTRCGVWKDSETLWNDTIQKFPWAARPWNYKGVTMTERDRYDLAYDCFDRAVTLKPNYSEALNNRGAVKLRRGDVAGGLADASRAIALNERYRDAYRNRSIAYSMLGEYERVIPESRRAIELDPTNPTTCEEYAAIGEAEQMLGRHREAISDYDEAIRTTPRGDPRAGRYFLSRSQSWSALGNRAMALSDAREAQRLGAVVDPGYLAGLGD